ncbi:hypothetical protein DICVIV_04614 [Dictyocaulus viviparus]|uniref:Dilute domain-containing protein n=1 Tax=Dictyocaulus viviparus TaxID=29172 RepID=A0A0D8XZR5_DICVI|nr:hypothetical protein DICVIV_04614 [Dictyocaulus viviparus]
MVNAAMNPPDYYCMTYGDFEDDDQDTIENDARKSLNEKVNRQSEELADVRAQLRGFSSDLVPSSASDVIRLGLLPKNGAEHSALLEVFNVPEFTRILICDLKPRLARLLTKALPAYIILAAFRYYDHAKDETGLTGLFTSLHIMLKDMISEWTAANTEVQNSHRFQSFDIAPIRDQLRLRVEECYHNLMKRAVEPILCPKIVFRTLDVTFYKLRW